MAALGTAALLLILAGLYWEGVQPLRKHFTALATPLHWLTDLPSRLWQGSDPWQRSRAELIEENRALQDELLVLRARSQRMAALLSENARLRALLRSSAPLQESVLVAEIIGLSPDPRSHTVVVNRGQRDGVALGQAVLDAHGLVGQVIEVTPVSSRVLLITDPTHAVPVQVGRNGVRAIAEGTGLVDTLDLPHVAATVDIRVGDRLESSGLGDRFPAGYPVAEVVSVTPDAGKPFLVVQARPMAWIGRSRHVLILLRAEAVTLPDEAAEAASVPASVPASAPVPVSASDENGG